MDLITITQYAGYFTGIVAGLAAAHKYVFRPIYRFIRSLIDLVVRLDKALPTVFAIAEQFQPNGGGSLRDVIDRIESQQLISKSRTKILLSLIDLGIFEADHEGQCLWVNRSWSSITGLTPEEAKDNGWVTAIHPDDREAVFDEWADSVRDERDFDLVYRYQNLETGKVTKVKGHATAIKNRNQPTIYLGTIIPVIEKEAS